MRTLATIVLGFVVIIAAFACFWFSICAASGDGMGGSRATYAFLDLVDIGIMVGAVLLMAKLSKRR